MELRAGQKWATTLKDIQVSDWEDDTVTVAKEGDRVKVLQEFPDMIFIQVENWECEVIVHPDNINIEEA